MMRFLPLRLCALALLAMLPTTSPAALNHSSVSENATWHVEAWTQQFAVAPPTLYNSYEIPGTGELSNMHLVLWTSDPFVWNDSRMVLFLSGFPSAEKNRIHLVCAESGEMLELGVDRDPIGKWTPFVFRLPREWQGRELWLQAEDDSWFNWLGWSEPVRLDSELWASIRHGESALYYELIGAWGAHGALFILPLVGAVFFFRAAFPRATVPLVSTGLLVGGVLAFGVFWTSLWSPALGRLLALALTLLGFWALLFYRRHWRSGDIGLVLIWLAWPLFYLSIAYLFGGMSDVLELARRRTAVSLPADNALPELLAAIVSRGLPLQPFFLDWLSSDRPPLQTGFVLWQRIFFWGESHVHYQVVASLLQGALIPVIVETLRSLRLRRRSITFLLLCLIPSATLFLHSVFVWPKLIPVAFMLILWQLAWGRWATGSPLLRWTGVGLAAGLAMLCHSGSIFMLAPMALVFLFRQKFPGVKAAILALIAFILLMIPWLAYQKVIDPPGTYLVKWHLAGAVVADDRGVGEAVKDAFRAVSPGEWLSWRWENLKALWGNLPEGWILFDAQLVLGFKHFQSAAFYHLVPALGLIALLGLSWLSPLRRKLAPQVRAFGLDAALILGLGIIFWVFTLFLPGQTVIHQGTLFTPMLLSLLLILPLAEGRPLTQVGGVLLLWAGFLVVWALPPLHPLGWKGFSIGYGAMYPPMAIGATGATLLGLIGLRLSVPEEPDQRAPRA